jgi:hypothetical protein
MDVFGTLMFGTACFLLGMGLSWMMFDDDKDDTL